MASSRIFVKNLPPKISEDDFRKHFGRKATITDAKLFPHRRIGYVGYKTPDDAKTAVKYYNKSFIRMSRIGVEIARPYSDHPTAKVGGKNDLSPNNASRTEKASHGLASEDSRDSTTEKSLKRKRGTPEETQQDPKLKEFLEVMMPVKKTKKGVSEPIVLPQPTSEESTIQAPVNDESEDDDYQTIDRKRKGSIAQEPTPPNDTEEAREEYQDGAGAEGITDDDWLRSRTQGNLNLDDDEGLGEGRDKDKEDGEDQKDSDDDDRSEEDEQEWSGLELPSQGNATSALDVNVSETPLENHQGPSGSTQDGASDSDALRISGRLFIRNLPYVVDAESIEDAFAAYGATQEIHIPIDSNSGKAKGFAYVQYVNPEGAVKAMNALDGSIFEGRLIHILPAAAKRESKLDDYALSKLPHKKQQQILRKAHASSSTFNWNSLYMNTDAVMSSISDRLGVSKSDVLDPTSADAAVKQAQAETHIIQETKSYFAENGVDLDAFKSRRRGDTAILVKNFPYGTTPDELKKMFEDFGDIKRMLMPPSGIIAIVEFTQPNHAKSAFGALAYRKIKDSILFLEKAPRDLFNKPTTSASASLSAPSKIDPAAPVSTAELLRPEETINVVDTSTLFVRNLNFATTTDRLIEAFKPLSGFLSARVKTKANTKKPGETLSMGFGFLEFRDKAQAQAALAAMNGYNLDGHKLQIRASQKAMDLAEERRKEDKAKKVASRKTKIIIKNLPFEASKKDVRSLFGSYGQLRSVRVPKKFDSSARGFAFADFTTPREAENAMDALRNTHFLGRRLVLDFAEEDVTDAEEEIERMQRKVGSQVNKVALQQLTGAGRKKFHVGGDDDDLEEN